MSPTTRRDPRPSAPALSALAAATSAALTLSWATPLAAQTVAAGNAGAAVVATPSLLPLLSAFLLVLALVPLALWMLKKSGAAQAAPAAGLRVVGQMALGTGQRLVVVEAGDRWLLLGVTAAQITRLGTLPRGAWDPAAGNSAPFAAILARLTPARDGRETPK
jgi:flagellar protein FliO/FliZ